MDAPAEPRRNDVQGTRVGFTREQGPADEDWRKRAACLPWRLKARGIAPRVFFPASFVSPEGKAEAELAKSVCADFCTVRAECLRHAFDSGCGDGVFGGLDPDERRAVKRRAARGRTGENRRYSDETRAEVMAALEAALPDHELVIERAAYAVGKAFGVDRKTILRWLDEETAPQGACGANAAPGGPDGREPAGSPREGALRTAVTA